MMPFLRSVQEDESHVATSHEPLAMALAEVTQQPGEAFGSRPLMAHETQALLRVLGPRFRRDSPTAELVNLLQLIDPLKDGGWDDVRLEAYIASATATLSQPLWLTNAFVALRVAQAQVARESRMRLFRTTLLKAAIAFFVTQLPPDEVELTHATG